MLDDRQSLVSPRAGNFGIGRDRTPAQTFQPALRLACASIASRAASSWPGGKKTIPSPKLAGSSMPAFSPACESICPGCESAGQRRHRFVRRRPHLRDAPAEPGLRARDPRSLAKRLRRFGRPGRHRRRRGLWLGDSDSSLHCVSSMAGCEVQSRISMGRMDFLGSGSFTAKGFNHQGHEGTRRKTLGLGWISFVVLRVLWWFMTF